MKHLKMTTFIICFLLVNCSNPPNNSVDILNGVWEDASRDFSGDSRIISTFKWGRAEIIRLHSFIFFITERQSVIITQNEAFYITKIEYISREKMRISCYLEESDSTNLYTYVFKVLDDTTLQFMPEESSTPLFPAMLKKGGKVYP